MTAKAPTCDVKHKAGSKAEAACPVHGKPAPASKTRRPRNAKKRKPGRQSSLTPRRAVRFLEAVATGNTLRTAARLSGVPDSTAKGWRQQGEVSIEQIRPANPEIEDDILEWIDERVQLRLRANAFKPGNTTAWDDDIPDFIPKEEERWWWAILFHYFLNYAQGMAEDIAVSAIRKAAPKDWRAAAFMLERTNPADWGLHTRTEVGGIPGQPVEVMPVSAADLADRIKALREQRLALEARRSPQKLTGPGG